MTRRERIEWLALTLEGLRRDGDPMYEEMVRRIADAAARQRNLNPNKLSS